MSVVYPITCTHGQIAVNRECLVSVMPFGEDSDKNVQATVANNGMSDLPMTVPAGQEAWRYAELVMYLPADWVHPGKANGDPQWLWPVQWLRKMAYYPHQDETWLGLPAAIISSDDPPVPLGPNTKQTCLFMIPDFANLDSPFQKPDVSPVHFFTVVPLYTEESDYELKHGMVAFLEQFSEHKVPVIVELDRPNFAVK